MSGGKVADGREERRPQEVPMQIVMLWAFTIKSLHLRVRYFVLRLQNVTQRKLAIAWMASFLPFRVTFHLLFLTSRTFPTVTIEW